MSEVTELKREIHKELETWHGVEGGIDEDGINKIMSLIDQLDKPETLSQAWIDEYQLMKLGPEGVVYYVPADDLKNLIVPKPEEVDQAYKDGYEKGKEHATKVIKPTIPKIIKVYIVFIGDEVKVFGNEDSASKFYNYIRTIDNRDIRLEEHNVIEGRWRN